MLALSSLKGMHMALSESSELKTESLVLTKDQSNRLRRIRDSRRTAVNRVSLSDIAREVVELGLQSFHLSESSEKTASPDSASTKAA